MDTSKKLTAGAAISLGLFGAINLLGSSVFSKASIDLTEERLYTLSDGAKDIARDLDEAIRLELYASKDLRDSSPAIDGFVRRVEDLLESFVAASDGKLKLERFDPKEWSEAEDEAALAGLPRVAGADGAVGYLGLVMRNSVGDTEVLPALRPNDEIFVEYEVAERLVSLDASDRPVLGVMTGLAIDGGPAAAPGQRGTPPWRVLELLGRSSEVRRIETTVDAIEDDVDVLMLLHPNGLSDATLYAIDQFALDGGRVIAFLDPFSVLDREGAQANGGTPPASDLGPLLEAWGVSFDGSRFVADPALAVLDPGGAGLMELRPRAEQVDATDPVSARLTDLRLITAGAVAPVDGASTTFAPLVTTTDEAGTLARSLVTTIQDPAELLERFTPTYETYTLAARVSGPIATAFPNGLATGEEDAVALPDGHLAESTSDFEAIVVADADMVYEGLWLGQFGLSKTAENIDLVLSAAEQLGGSDALLSLRARGTFSRPFEVVEELRRKADEKFASEQARLEKELEEIDVRIQEIARDQGGGGPILLTDELQEEFDKAVEKRDATRKELRRVRFDLERDEEALGRRVKAINVLGMPLVVVASGLLVWLRRRGRANA